MKSYVLYSNKRGYYFGESIDMLMSLILFVCLFVYFWSFVLKEDVSIIHAVCLMDPVAIGNNDYDAFCWAQIIKSPRVFIICLTGF